MSNSIFKGTKLYKGFKTDPTKENNGVWRDHDESGIVVKIRRSSRPEHKAALRKFFKPFAHLTSVPPKEERLVKMKAGAQELVAAWGVRKLDDEGRPLEGDENILPLVDDEGNEIRATEENVLTAFREMPDFFGWVSEEADTFEHYRLAIVEEAGGNSLPTSTGSSSGETLTPPPSSSDGQAAVSASAPSRTDQS